MKSVHPKDLVRQHLIPHAPDAVADARSRQLAAAARFREDGMLVVAAVMEETVPDAERRAAKEKVFASYVERHYRDDEASPRQIAADVVVELFDALTAAIPVHGHHPLDPNEQSKTPWFQTRDNQDNPCWIRIGRSRDISTGPYSVFTLQKFTVTKRTGSVGDIFEGTEPVDDKFEGYLPPSLTEGADSTLAFIERYTRHTDADHTEVVSSENQPHKAVAYMQPEDLFACIENLVIPEAPQAIGAD